VDDYFAYIFSRVGATEHLNEQIFLTSFFCFFIFITNFNSFNVRTPSTNVFRNLFSNKNFVAIVFLIFTVQITFTYLGGSFLRTVGLLPSEWFKIILLAMTILPIDILRKKVIDPILERRYNQIYNRIHKNEII